MTFDFIAQLIGLVASAVIISAYFIKEDNRFKLVAILGNIFYVIHFFMLGAYGGSAVRALNIFRTAGSIYFHRSNRFMLIFIACYFFVSLIIAENLIDYLPFLTAIIGTYALFNLSGAKLRVLMIICSAMWLIYNIYFMSIGGVISELFIISANITTIFRLSKK